MTKPSARRESDPGEAAASPAEPRPLLSREEAATRLGVSVSTLRRRFEGTRLPVRLAGRAHVFERARVEALALELGVPPSNDDATPTDELREARALADVFALLNRGVDPTAVVERLPTVHADLVERACAQWARLQGALLLTADDLARLQAAAAALGWSAPVTSSAALVELLRFARDRPRPLRCGLCAKRTAEVCPACFGHEQRAHEREEKARLRKHEAELAKMARDGERSRLEHQKRMHAMERERLVRERQPKVFCTHDQHTRPAPTHPAPSSEPANATSPPRPTPPPASPPRAKAPARPATADQIAALLKGKLPMLPDDVLAAMSAKILGSLPDDAIVDDELEDGLATVVEALGAFARGLSST